MHACQTEGGGLPDIFPCNVSGKSGNMSGIPGTSRICKECQVPVIPDFHHIN